MIRILLFTKHQPHVLSILVCITKLSGVWDWHLNLYFAGEDNNAQRKKCLVNCPKATLLSMREPQCMSTATNFLLGFLFSQWGVNRVNIKIFYNGGNIKTPLSITQIIFTFMWLDLFACNLKQNTSLKAKNKNTTTNKNWYQRK